MNRHVIKPRSNWKQCMETIGFDFHTDPDGYPYWNEAAYYELSGAAASMLESSIAELHQMCLIAVDHIVRHEELLELLKIPPAFWSIIKASWEKKEPTLYGRFDLMFDGVNPPKLLEYNADTPTTLLEASVAQWNWKKEVFPDASQFNIIHEKLIDAWKSFQIKEPVHFTSISFSLEDFRTTMYLMDTAHQSGITGQCLKVEEIGWDNENAQFVDSQCQPIRNLFKLYPYEWMLREEFGPYMIGSDIKFIEPPWKMVLSNKGILPILWQLFRGHSLLLPSYFTPHDDLKGCWVKKALYGREGENITFQCGSESFWTRGQYGSAGYIFQEYCPIVDFAGSRPIVGGWVVGGQPAGIGIREDSSAITGNTSLFVPHLINPNLSAKTIDMKTLTLQSLMREHSQVTMCNIKLPYQCTVM